MNFILILSWSLKLLYLNWFCWPIGLYLCRLLALSSHWPRLFKQGIQINTSNKTELMQLRIEGRFGFRTFWTKFCNILKYGMNLKFETIVQIFRTIIQLNAVIILKSTNEYYRKIISKSGFKMDLYPAMRLSNYTFWPLHRDRRCN